MKELTGLSGSLPLSPLPALPSLAPPAYRYPKLLEYLFLLGGAAIGSAPSIPPVASPVVEILGNFLSPKLEGTKGLGGEGLKGNTGDDPVLYAAPAPIGDEGPASYSPPPTVRDDDARTLVGLNGAGAGRPAGTDGRDGSTLR